MGGYLGKINGILSRKIVNFCNGNQHNTKYLG